MSFLSAALGLDASHNAGVAQTQANKAQDEASAYRNQAAGLYGGLSQSGQTLEGQGKSQYDHYAGLIDSLLPQYEGATGINGGNAPGGTVNPGGTVSPSNSFALSPEEQQQLKSQVDAINQQHQAAQQTWVAEAAKRGFVDPSATAAQNETIRQHFDQAVNDHTAQFHLTARQNRINSIMNLLGFGASQQGAGLGAEEAGLGVRGGAASGVAGLGGQAMENSAQQSGNAARLNAASNNALGNFGGLASFGLSQLFGKKAGSSGDDGNSGAAAFPGSNGLPALIPGSATAPASPSVPNPITPSYFLMGGNMTGGVNPSGDATDNSMFNQSGGF